MSDPSGLCCIGESVTLNLQADDGINTVGTAAVTITIQGNLDSLISMYQNRYFPLHIHSLPGLKICLK